MSSIFENLPAFLELGSWTTRHIRPLFDLFRDEDVAPALALIIFGSALVLCVLFIINSSFIRIQVRRRIRAVRNIKGKVEFVEAMPDLEKLMLQTKYLRHSWQKFRETLIEPSGDEERGPKVVLNTARPQNYFNTAEAGLRFPLYRAMPNLLVGIGLLLTFFGLVTALYFTTTAIKGAADLATSQNALRDLLYAASFKFYTSIAGLGGSIVLTLVLRYGTSAIENTFDALASTLESKLVFITPESIAFNQYREAQEQTRNLKLFNTEVAISVGKRIEEALAATLPTYLAQAMAPIGKSLDEVANKLTSMNEGAIGEMAGNFVDKLQGATGEQMQGLATTLGELGTSLERIKHGMNESGAALEDVSRKISEVISETTSRMTASSEKVSGTFNAELVATTKNFQDVSDRMASRIEEAVSAVTRGLINESGSIGERVAQAAMQAGEESRSKVIDAGTDLAQTLSDIGQQLTDAVNRMQEGLNGQMGDLAKPLRLIKDVDGFHVRLPGYGSVGPIAVVLSLPVDRWTTTKPERQRAFLNPASIPRRERPYRRRNAGSGRSRSRRSWPGNVSTVEKVSRWRRCGRRQPAPWSSLEQPLAGCGSRSCDRSGAGALRRLWTDIRGREAGRAS